MAHTATATPATSGTPRILEREPLVLNNRSYAWITNRICGIVENRQPMIWWILFVPSVILTSFMVFCFAYLISTGVGEELRFGKDVVMSHALRDGTTVCTHVAAHRGESVDHRGRRRIITTLRSTEAVRVDRCSSSHRSFDVRCA